MQILRFLTTRDGVVLAITAAPRHHQSVDRSRNAWPDYRRHQTDQPRLDRIQARTFRLSGRPWSPTKSTCRSHNRSTWLSQRIGKDTRRTPVSEPKKTDRASRPLRSTSPSWLSVFFCRLEGRNREMERPWPSIYEFLDLWSG